MSLNDIFDDLAKSYTKKDSPVVENTCICPNCGNTKQILQENVECTDCPCSKCGFDAMLSESDLEQIKSAKNNDIIVEDFEEPTDEVTLSAQIKTIVTESLQQKNETPPPRYQCESCHTIIPENLYEHIKGQCPQCGLSVDPMYENVSLTEKRFNCQGCGASFLYENTMSNVCSICSGLMVAYAPAATKFKDILNK